MFFVCVSVCNAPTCESLDLEGTWCEGTSSKHLVKFAYQGRGVKVRVTEAKRGSVCHVWALHFESALAVTVKTCVFRMTTKIEFVLSWNIQF